MIVRNNILKLTIDWESKDPQSLPVTKDWTSPSPGLKWRLTNWEDDHTCTVQSLCEAGTTFDYHEHPNHDELIVIIEGRGEIDIVKKHHVLEAGQSLVIPRGLLHRGYYPVKTKLLLVFQE